MTWCYNATPRPPVALGVRACCPAKRARKSPVTLRITPIEAAVLRDIVLPSRYQWNVVVESVVVGRDEFVEHGFVLAAGMFSAESVCAGIASGRAIYPTLGLSVSLRRLSSTSRAVVRAVRVRRTRGGSIHVARVWPRAGVSRRERLSLVVVVDLLPDPHYAPTSPHARHASE